MTSKKYQYDNTEVVIISSKPTSERRKYTEAYMEKVKATSDLLLKQLEEINRDYPRSQSSDN